MISSPPALVTDEQLSALFWHSHRRVVGFTSAAFVLAMLGFACLAAGYIEAAAGFGFAGIANAYPATWYRARCRLLTHLRFGRTGPQRNEGINR